MSRSSYCDNCGNELDTKDIFCPNCGKKQNETTSQEQSVVNSEEKIQQITYPSRKKQQEFSSPRFDQNLEKQNIINGSKKMLANPSEGSITYVAYSDAPTSFPIVLFRAVLIALSQYLILSTDEYFEVIYRENLEAAAVQQGVTVEFLRSSLVSFIPAFYAISVIFVWFFSSWLLSVVSNSGVHPESPVKNDTFAALRRLNGYKSIPIAIAHLVSIVLIFIVDPSVYLSVIFYIYLIGSLYSAYMLYRGYSKNIGYLGSWNTIGAIITVLFLLLFRL